MRSTDEGPIWGFRNSEKTKMRIFGSQYGKVLHPEKKINIGNLKMFRLGKQSIVRSTHKNQLRKYCNRVNQETCYFYG